MPALQCLIAESISSHCGCACLPATMTFTRLRERKHQSETHNSVLASGGRKTRITSAFLLTT